MQHKEMIRIVLILSVAFSLFGQTAKQSKDTNCNGKTNITTYAKNNDIEGVKCALLNDIDVNSRNKY